MKKIILILVTFLSAKNVLAQMSSMPLGNRKTDKTEYMFNTYKDELDINFEWKISQDVVMHFSMTRMGLWQGKDEFRKPLLSAVEQLKLYQDSVSKFANSKRLDIHENPDGKVFSKYTTSTINNNIRVVNSGSLEALKTGRDTLRIVKAFESRKQQGLMMPERMQYTFEMKELKEFSALLADEKWVDKSVKVIDSVVKMYQKKWRNPDAGFHSLYVNAFPKGSGNQLIISKRDIGDYNRMSGILTLNGGFGVSLVRNDICPTVNVGLQFHFAGDYDYVPFVRLSLNSFTRFEQKPDKKFQSFSTSFINAEFGTQTNEQNKFNKNFLFSMGLGYKLTTKEQIFRDPSLDKHMYKLFFNYSLNNNIILQPEFITNFKRREKENGWIGIAINFQLF